ncbi:PhzF family phenazine biosynthesis protein [Desulfosporosinus nitroreducens]|uniref:PhzF family phenazine biosynthesis protein n=1 Tax=Desulfosporosinus nitroreducens TaxID=2018668 RepID=A0ABT8QRC3_9FIRM|nr:PhzF family phenazine biosynthesis protein [Desulfosporosinus nitroreducens]MCO1603111.1 PhzF family phenazine biosynthesis protein [Desulfosporosinus nitroreducens]MDO0823882.1 PhzF family phenazine biosynthesis protein [Desulfosporosinus nitroreducens]
MKVKAYKINAFAKTVEGGNPAGVVINVNSLSENDMKKIAGILGLSETAFVMKSDIADYRVRFFTPTEEVDLCGHATIAAFSTLLSEDYIKRGNYTQETKAGVLNVEVMADSSIMMNQTKPSFYEAVEKQEIADSLNISVDDMNEKLPAQIVSTGLRDIIVPIRSMEVLNGIKPDFEKVSEISKKYNTIGYHLFALDSLYDSNAHCRNLAPLYGIPEESATGTSNGALACYLLKYDQLKHEHVKNMVFEQGYSMNMPSEIMVSLSVENNEIYEVKVGGKALNLSRIEVEL